MPEIGEIRRGCEIGFSGGKWIWQPCEICQKERWVILVKGTPEYSRCLRCACHLKGKAGKEHPVWNGGRNISNGYITIRLEPDDFFYPMASRKGGVVLEHRLVMAKHLNRCLLPWEVVHHKGTKYPSGSIENRSDNRLENLQLLPAGKYHLPDQLLKSRVKRLEVLVEKQSQRIKLLEWHIKELNQIKIREV